MPRIVFTHIEVEGTSAEVEETVRRLVSQFLPKASVAAAVAPADAQIREPVKIEQLPTNGHAAAAASAPPPAQKKRVATPQSTPGREAVWDHLNNLGGPVSFSKLATANVVPTGSLHSHLTALMAAGRIRKNDDRSYEAIPSSSDTGATS